MKSSVELHAKTIIKQDGFTLIEILTVVAIASVLAMISMPFYQSYAVRARISGDFPLMHPLMLRMNEEYAVNNAWPSSNAQAGAHAPEHYSGKYLASTQITDNPQAGTMTLTYDATELPVLLGTNTIVFYPRNTASGAQWQCDQGTIPAKYRPPQCRQ